MSATQLQELLAAYRHAQHGPIEDTTFGFWKQDLAAVAFTKSSEMYIAAASDEEMERFAVLHGLKFLDC